MPMYRKPTSKERAKIQKARGMTMQGMEGEKDMLSRFSTTSAKGARDQYKMGRKMMEEVPAEARAYEAEEGNPGVGTYKAGGMVSVRGQGAARKTKGCKIT
jgi:hypothetical protein